MYFEETIIKLLHICIQLPALNLLDGIQLDF